MQKTLLHTTNVILHRSQNFLVVIMPNVFLLVKYITGNSIFEE